MLFKIIISLIKHVTLPSTLGTSDHSAAMTTPTATVELTYVTFFKHQSMFLNVDKLSVATF